jgi:hypothetical protein
MLCQINAPVIAQKSKVIDRAFVRHGQYWGLLDNNQLGMLHYLDKGLGTVFKATTIVTENKQAAIRPGR